MREINRRAFIGLGAGAVAWACARNGEQATPSPTASPAGAGPLAVQLSADPNHAVAVGDSRLAFVLLDRDRELVKPEGLRAAIVPEEGEAVELDPSTVQIRIGLGGEEDHDHPEGTDADHEHTEAQELYVVRHTFTEPGIHRLVVATPAGGRLEARGQAVFNVLSETPVPTVGEQAIAVPSPTTADPRGVDPICTRTPSCSMHDVPIDEALRSGRPTVITFATPRYCTSRTCGPVVDIIEAAKEEHAAGAEFVHVEVWKNAESVGQGPDATVDAFREWNLQTEPWVFFVRPDGVVAQRWVGAVGREETLEAVRALVAGEL